MTMPVTMPAPVESVLSFTRPASGSLCQNAAETQLAAALLRLSLDRPYLTAALWSLRRVPTEAIDTMAVDDCWRLYYNPARVATDWRTEETAAVLYHEICHLLRDHAARAPAGARCNHEEAFLWNLAADAEINDDLKAEGQALPGSPVFPATLGSRDGLTAEEYYALLDKARTLPTPSEGDFSGEVAGGHCGSCAHGRRAAFEEAATAAGIEGMPETEDLLVRRSVALAVQNAVAKGHGNIPGHWTRWADETLAPPAVDWRRELASAVRRAVAETAGRLDYRYARPGRRQASQPDFVVPGLIQPIPRVAVAIDTSGSMSADDLARAVSETAGILKALGLRDGVTVLAVDAAVHTCRTVFDPRQVRTTLKGGGGTDMGAALAAAEQLRPLPNTVIVITDGYTPWPANPPQGIGRVIVVLTGECHWLTPSWAQTIRAT